MFHRCWVSDLCVISHIAYDLSSWSVSRYIFLQWSYDLEELFGFFTPKFVWSTDRWILNFKTKFSHKNSGLLCILFCASFFLSSPTLYCVMCQCHPAKEKRRSRCLFLSFLFPFFSSFDLWKSRGRFSLSVYFHSRFYLV